MKSLERQLQTSLAIVLILILLGLVVIANLSTRNLLQQFVTSHLEHEAERLFDALDVSGAPKVRWRRLDPNYNSVNSGNYYSIKFGNAQSSNQLIRSPSLKDENLPDPSDSMFQHNEPFIVHDVVGPQAQHLIIWSKAYQKEGHDMVISIAEDMSALMSNRVKFSILFVAIGLIGFVLIFALQRFVIRRLFKNLDVSRQEIKQIESGERKQLSEDVPTEIYPLVKEFNHSLSLMQQRMERSRNSLGNLAHALKTPLSLLIQQLDGAKSDLPDAKKQAERIRQLTERELKRARMAGLGNTTQRFDPKVELPILSNVLKQALNKQELEINIDIAEGVNKFGDREDMLELLGNLLDNACKWAAQKVTCTISAEQDIKIVIEDDGEGRTREEVKSLTQRGIRVDESIEGHGLGLAICKDIVKLYGGSIRFCQSEDLGGFLVEVLIPRS